MGRVPFQIDRDERLIIWLEHRFLRSLLCARSLLPLIKYFSKFLRHYDKIFFYSKQSIESSKSNREQAQDKSTNDVKLWNDSACFKQKKFLSAMFTSANFWRDHHSRKCPKTFVFLLWILCLLASAEKFSCFRQLGEYWYFLKEYGELLCRTSFA